VGRAHGYFSAASLPHVELGGNIVQRLDAVKIVALDTTTTGANRCITASPILSDRGLESVRAR
jgi:hypothetical protein